MEETRQDFYFEYSFTQTVSGFAAAPSSLDLEESMKLNWGGLPGFTIDKIEKTTEEQSKALRERISNEEGMLN